MKLNLLQEYKSVFSKQFLCLYLIYFTFFLTNGVFEQSLPLLFEQYQFSEQTYGLLLSINNGLSIFLPTLAATISVKYGAGKIGLLGILLVLLGAFALGSIRHAVPAILSALILYSGRTVFNFSFGNDVNQYIQNSDRAKYFVIRDIFLFGGISIGLFLGGILIGRSSISAFYQYFGAVCLICIFFLRRFYRTRKALNAAAQEEGDDSPKSKISYRTLLKDKKVMAFIIINALTSIYGVSCSFIPLLGTSLGIDTAHMLSLLGFISVINTLISIVFARITDNLGRKSFYIFDIAFDTLPAVLFALTSNIYVFILGLVLSMVKDAFAPISFAYFFDCFSGSDSSLVLGLTSSVSSAVNLVIPILVSLLWSVSSKYVFLVGACCNIAAALVAAALLPNSPPPKEA